MIVFNETKKFQAVPYISILEGQPVQCVPEIGILWLLLDHKLTWWSMVEDITRRATNKVWHMIRLRENGVSQSQLLTVYIARVRSILEDCAPVYCGLLNASQRNKLEGLQILAVAVIMGVHATSYAQGLLSLGITTLEERRLTLTKSFAIKTYKSSRFSNWFTAHPPPPRGSRQVMPRFYIPRFKTSRALGAPLIFYAELLNDVTDEELSSGIDTSTDLK